MDEHTRKTIERLISFGYTENVDIIDPLNHGEGEVVLSEPDGVLVRHACGSWLTSVRTESAAEQVIRLITDDEILCTHGPVGLDMFIHRLGKSEVQDCYQVVLDHPLDDDIGPDPKESSATEEFVFTPLDKSHLDLIVPYYHTAPPEYVQERLEAGVMIGAWSKDRLAGFIGRHAEGAMGLLEVVPEFRRCGLGTALERELCRSLQAQGRIPYAHVFTDNTVSLALQRKLGLSFATHLAYWLDKAVS